MRRGSGIGHDGFRNDRDLARTVPVAGRSADTLVEMSGAPVHGPAAGHGYPGGTIAVRRAGMSTVATAMAASATP